MTIRPSVTSISGKQDQQPSSFHNLVLDRLLDFEAGPATPPHAVAATPLMEGWSLSCLDLSFRVEAADVMARFFSRPVFTLQIAAAQRVEKKDVRVAAC